MNRDNVKAIAGFVLGLAIGAGIAWGLMAARDPRVEIIEGHTTNVNEAGTAIGLATEPGGPGRGYTIARAFWREEGGPWTLSVPTCLEPLTSDQAVRMGVIQVKPAMGTPGREMVVWLECLD